jgi:hypothetical protein
MWKIVSIPFQTGYKIPWHSESLLDLREVQNRLKLFAAKPTVFKE